MADVAPRPPKRTGGWKIAGLIAAIVAVLILAYALYVHSVAERRWTAMEQSVQELRSISDQRNGPRPVLRGTAVPGNAWEDYDPALLTMKGAPSRVLGEYVSRGPKADRQKLEAALAAHGAALDGLRKGAMRAEGIYRTKWEDGWSADIPGLLQSQNLANLAVCRARLLSEEGRSREAADLLLDTCQFGRDLGYNQQLISEMIAIAITAIALEELRDLLLAGKFSREELEEIDRELAILDGSFPQNAHSLMNNAMATGYGFLKSGGGLGELVTGTDLGWGYYLWRSVFPERLICADAYFVELDTMKRSVEADRQSWGACEAIGLKIQTEIPKLRNPVARMTLPGLYGSNRAGRELRVKLRLVRAAAHYRATGKVPDLEDPFGDRLLSSVQGAKIKVWSVGRDRLDGGGNGGWKPNAGPDIVLEFGK